MARVEVVNLVVASTSRGGLSILSVEAVKDALEEHKRKKPGRLRGLFKAS